MEVDPEALDRHARSVEALADDLRADVARWHTALSSPCAPAVAAVRDAYLKDFSVCAEVLRSWAEAAQSAAATYRETDHP